jgi:hypothetical protein
MLHDLDGDDGDHGANAHRHIAHPHGCSWAQMVIDGSDACMHMHAHTCINVIDASLA